LQVIEQRPDRVQHDCRLGQHLPIAEADDAKSELPERLVTLLITQHGLGLSMLISIQLDDKPVAQAAEVQDVRRERMLPAELDAKGAVSQSLPQAALGVRLVLAKSTGKLRR